MRQMAAKVADVGTRTRIIKDVGTGKLNRAVETFRMEEEVLNEGTLKIGKDNRESYETLPEPVRCQLN